MPYGTGNPNLAQPNPGGGPVDPFLTDGNAVLQAIHDVQSHYTQPIRVTSISAHAEGLILDVVLPTDRARVVRYIIPPNGKIIGPIPVKLVVNGRVANASDVASLAFDPTTLPFARLEPALRDAVAHSKIDDARIFQWGLGGANKDVYVIVDGPVVRRVAFFNHQLRFLRMFD